MTIREYLKHHRLVTDGAMGTYYAEHKQGSDLVSEWANLKEPELIAQIHREYLEAGAVLLRTNTFAAGRCTLGISAEKQQELVRAGCRIARQEMERFEKETGKKCFLAGDIGPLRNISDTGEEENIEEEYKDLIGLFLSEGVDAILFETFSDLDGILQSAEYAKKKAPEIFCIAEFSVNKNGYSPSGIRAARLLKQAEEIEALDAIGLNCGVGSAHMLALLHAIHPPKEKYFCISPNAGYPEQLQNRMVFMKNAKYFGENIRKIASYHVAILGACCGSTPEYIKELAKIAETLPPVEFRVPEKKKKTESPDEKKISSNSDDKLEISNGAVSGRLMELFERKKKVIAVEIDPPYHADDTKIVQAAIRLKELGADVLTIADSPQGRSRMDSVLTAVKLQNITGLPVMPHICCRDKNRIAMRSMLLGAYANDIRNILLVTGDPVPSELRSSATGVFDYNSTKLMGMVREMNMEHFSDDPIFYGGAINQGRLQFDKELDRTKKKIEAGASWFLTQPVYCEEEVKRLRTLKEETGTKLFAGIMPLVSYRNANFVKNEMVGIYVPDKVLSEYHPDMSREEGEETGVRIVQRIMEVMDFADGFYFMLPFNRVSLMEKLLVNLEIYQ